MKMTTGGKPRKQMTKDEQIDDLKKLCRFFELENRELREQVKNLTIPVVMKSVCCENCMYFDKPADCNLNDACIDFSGFKQIVL